MKELSSDFIQRVPQAEERVTVTGQPFIDRDEGINLRDYWSRLKKYRWLIVTFFFGVILATALVLLTMTPVYTAETTLIIEPPAPHVLDIRQALSESVGSDEYDYYKTQHTMLKSRGLVAQVIQEENLLRSLFAEEDKDAGLLSGLWESMPEWGIRGSSLPPDVAESWILGIPPALIDKYIGLLNIRPVKQTRLVRVAFTTPDPNLSARVATAHATAYIRKRQTLRRRTNEEAVQFLEQKLVELKDRVEKSEAALNQYRRDRGVISLDEKENIVVDRLSDLNKRLTEAEVERIALEAQVYMLRKRDYNSLPAVLNNPLIQTLKEQQARLEADYARLFEKFRPDYPDMVQLKAQIDETKKRLQEEIQRVVAGLKSAYLVASKEEEELRTKMDEQKAATLGLKDDSVGYVILAREVDTNRQLYDSILQRMKEMGITEGMKTSNVTIVDQAEAPMKPSSPKKALSLLVSACIGLLGGVSLAFFFEYLDNTLKTPEEVEHYLRLPNLAVVPDFASIDSRPHYGDPPQPLLLASGVENGEAPPLKKGEFGEKYQRSFVKPSPYGRGQKTEFILPQHPLSVVTEAYRCLRASLLMTRAGGPSRTILFTSGTNAEGKTSTTVNTAVVFAHMGFKVLVVDGDLRRPCCHKILRMAKEPGLTELLTGQLELPEVITATSIENLYLLSSGAVVPDPGELVGSRHIKDTLAVLQQHYDYIFVDSPPILPVSDALLLSASVDGVILVVRGEETPKHIVKEARVRLGYAQARLLGVVLNGVNMKSGDYAYSYGNYSSYYHPQKAGEEALSTTGH